jgi:hypothetical protein
MMSGPPLKEPKGGVPVVGPWAEANVTVRAAIKSKNMRRDVGDILILLR